MRKMWRRANWVCRIIGDPGARRRPPPPLLRPRPRRAPARPSPSSRRPCPLASRAAPPAIPIPVAASACPSRPGLSASARRRHSVSGPSPSSAVAGQTPSHRLLARHRPVVGEKAPPRDNNG
ncbi:hypothetical protein ZWY2020_052133 [Hordeum vulgare]|nr:hypothetical protein ZWY2020_052133 [Hordeum vulgare]